MAFLVMIFVIALVVAVIKRLRYKEYADNVGDHCGMEG
jgi:hypothetical protein